MMDDDQLQLIKAYQLNYGKPDDGIAFSCD